MKPKPKLRKPARPSAPPTATSPSTAAAATSTSESKTPVKFGVNVVIPPGVAGPIGRFLQAGTESPFRSLDEVPPSLRGFIASSDDELEPVDEPQNAIFTLNSQYAVGEDGRRGRSLQREVIRLEQQAAEQEFWVQRLGEPSEQEQRALEIIQQDHETAVARDTAVAQYRAKEAAMANEHARQFVEEGEQIEGEQTL